MKTYKDWYICKIKVQKMIVPLGAYIINQITSGYAWQNFQNNTSF